MSLDVSQRHNNPHQVGLHIRVLKEEPQLQSPKEPQLQLLLRTGKEQQLRNPQGIGKIVVPTHLRDQEDTGVDYNLRTCICSIPPFG